MDFHTTYEAYKMAHSENMAVTSGSSIWVLRDLETMNLTMSGFHSSSTIHNPADGNELLGDFRAWNVRETEDFNQAEYNADPEKYVNEVAYWLAEQDHQ